MRGAGWLNWSLGFCAGAALATWLSLSCAVSGAQSVPGSAVGELIDAAAAYEGIPWAAPAMRRIAWCESRWFPGAFNRVSGASGVFQFVARTWAWASRGAGWAGASPFDAVANVYSAAYLYRVGGAGHWSCR